MITESVVCVVLHCSRCNAAFRDEASDEYTGTVHWDSADDITESFARGNGECGGWRRFGDRIVCQNCQITTGFGDDPDAREMPEPLPAADGQRVALTQAGYATASRHVVNLTDAAWTIRHPVTCRPALFDCPVNAAAERDLTDPPAGTGLFVCDVDSNGAFVVLNEVPA